MSRSPVLACLILTLLVGSLPSTATGVLKLRTGDTATADSSNLLLAPATGFSPGTHHIIQLAGPITPERRAALLAAGVRLGDYLPDHAYVARLDRTSPAALAQLGFVTWVGEYRPEWRLDPRIGRTELLSGERLQQAARGQFALSVYLFDGDDLVATLTAIQQINGAQVFVIDFIGTQPVLNVLMPAAGVAQLVSVSGVQYVEEYPEFTYRNNSDRWIVQSNIQDFTPLYDHGLHGEGQVLGHMDQKVAVDHCSFHDAAHPVGPDHRKILAYNQARGYGLHGTHTAGTAVGDAGSFTETRGVAYLARMVHNAIPSFSESGMFTALDLHRTQGATVHTNSWGNDGTTAYDGLCRAIDNFSWQHDEQLVCFAVTNLSSLKNPENAKNCLAVAATRDAPNQQDFCSGGAGPTSDGRRKPEIMAPGCSIPSSSGSSGCSTSSLTGTSMACPAVCGTALLVRQYFTDGYYPTGTATPAHGFTPSGALLKALLLNSAADMTGISGYPSNREGWGRVLADAALYFPADMTRLYVQDMRNNAAGALSTGQSVTYPVVVSHSTPQLRVTLVWHDAPAASNASYAPINDLDLTATAPDGTTYKGNVFVNGLSEPGGDADPKNNVEQIHVNSPPTGTWSIGITGSAVNVGEQGYALVATGGLALIAPGDVNCDGVVDFADVDVFVLALSDSAAYHGQYPACHIGAADVNADGVVDFADINPFIALLPGK